MAIQVRRGLLKDFDPEKMLPGEWAASIDSETRNQQIYMCFAPGVVKRMGTYEDFAAQIADATEEIKQSYITAFNEILEQIEADKDVVDEEYAYVVSFKKELDESYVPEIIQNAEKAEEMSNSAATSATNAAGFAASADSSASLAAKKATEASGSAHNASCSATDAESYAVGGTGNRVNEDRDNAKYYSEQANESSSAAATSENNAATSASTASSKATAAATSATNASKSAGAAATSENNAATSASTASSKATAAATSATNAANSASAAATSEKNAATSASTASSKATAAATSATNAAKSAGAAETSATNAATSASTASSKATAAATSATNAANSAGAAATSANTASSKATAAATSAANAKTSENNAAKYAEEAKSVADSTKGNTTGATNKLKTKLYLTGAINQEDAATTYSNNGVYIGADNEVYSAGKKVAHEGDSPTSHKHTKSEITDFPTIPTVGNGKVTVMQNSVVKATFTMNQSGNITIELTDTNTTYNLASFGINATATELNFVDGVTSNIQNQLNGKSNSGHSHSNYAVSNHNHNSVYPSVDFSNAGWRLYSFPSGLKIASFRGTIETGSFVAWGDVFESSNSWKFEIPDFFTNVWSSNCEVEIDGGCWTERNGILGIAESSTMYACRATALGSKSGNVLITIIGG